MIILIESLLLDDYRSCPFMFSYFPSLEEKNGDQLRWLRGLRDVTQKSPDVKMHSQVEGESR